MFLCIYLRLFPHPFIFSFIFLYFQFPHDRHFYLPSYHQSKKKVDGVEAGSCVYTVFAHVCVEFFPDCRAWINTFNCSLIKRVDSELEEESAWNCGWSLRLYCVLLFVCLFIFKLCIWVITFNFNLCKRGYSKLQEESAWYCETFCAYTLRLFIYLLISTPIWVITFKPLSN